MWDLQENGATRATARTITPFCRHYSDEDVIWVGSDYYMISSTMQLSPGMIVLHSKDLVNWQIIGHVVSDMTQISSAKSNGASQNTNNMNVQCIAESNGITTIKLPLQLSSNALVTMYDIVGRTIPLTIEPSRMDLSIHRLSNGVAFLRIQNGRLSAVTKVILK